jgi:hypothetical protein
MGKAEALIEATSAKELIVMKSKGPLMQRSFVDAELDADRIAISAFMGLTKPAAYLGATVKLPLFSGPVP